MAFSFSLHRALQLLRSPERDIVAVIVHDPLKVQREIRFLFLRLAIFFIIAISMIVASVFSIRRGVARLEESRAAQRQLYSKFESMARLSHDVREGRAALENIQTLFPKDDNLLPFLEALDALATATGNRTQFSFEGAPLLASDIPPYRFVTYTITLEGDSHSFLRYLAAFPALPYLVVLDSMTLQGESSIHERSVMHLKGKLYVQ